MREYGVGGGELFGVFPRMNQKIMSSRRGRVLTRQGDVWRREALGTEGTTHLMGSPGPEAGAWANDLHTRSQFKVL